MSNCKSCHAKVFWARTDSGKTMPVDPPGRHPEPNIKSWRNAEGELRTGTEPPRGADVRMTTSHYATCPDADKWRKR